MRTIFILWENPTNYDLMKNTLLFTVLTVFFGLKSLTAQNNIRKSLDLQPPLFNGKEYHSYNLPVSGLLFYANSEDVGKNTVKFDKVIYGDLALFYDLRTDQLISIHPKHLNKVILVKEFVDFFTIGSDTLVYLSEKETGLNGGYYLQVFNSDTYKSYAKYSKTVKEATSNFEKRSVEDKVKYFYKTPASSHLIPYKHIKDLINLDKQHKKAVKNLIRDNDLQFEKDLKTKSHLVLGYLSKVSQY